MCMPFIVYAYDDCSCSLCMLYVVCGCSSSLPFFFLFSFGILFIWPLRNEKKPNSSF